MASANYDTEITMAPTMTPQHEPAIVPADALRIGTGRTRRFVGRDHGAGISYFFVDNDPGEGPGLHWHPYSETWVVRKGEAEFTVGAERTLAYAGDIVVAAANVPHRFENVGRDRLEIVCIHPNDTIVQDLVDA